MFYNRLFFLILLFATMAFTLKVQAQQRLSLSEAITRALENNYQIQIQDAAVDIARLNNVWGATGRLPQVNFRVNTDNTRAPGTFRVSGDQIAAGPIVTWQLFDGFRTIAAKDQLATLESLSEGNAAVIVENTLQAVILAYYDVLISEARSQVLEEVLRFSQERLRYQNFRTEVGAAGRFELLQFMNSVASDSANLLLQRLNVANSRRLLNQLMSISPDSVFALTDSLPRVFSNFQLGDLSARVQASNNALRNQNLFIRLRAAEYKIARSELYPDLNLSLSSNYAVGTSRLIDGRTIDQNAFQSALGLRLNFNLYNGGQVRRAIQQAEINQQVAMLSQSEMNLSVENALKTAYEQYQTFKQVFNLQEYNVANAKENLFLAGERFNSGLINAIDYRSIQVQYLDTQLARLQALRDIQISETELIRLSGGFIR